MISWIPDFDPATPEVLADVTEMYPSQDGYYARPGAVSTGIEPLAAKCLGAVKTLLMDGTRRVIAGTETKLYEASSTAWSDVSKVGSYTGAPDARWRFAQFGNVTLATNKIDAMQFSVSSGAFADLAGAPKASIVATATDFVFAVDTNDGTYGDTQNRWWCCAKGDYTDWTPDIATECVTGVVTDSPGGFRAARRLGSSIILYKEAAMYVGSYVGAPFVWDFDPVPGVVGAVNQESVVDVGTAHFFLDKNDFWMFDGSRPVPIGSAQDGRSMVREWFFANASPSFLYLTRGVHNPTAALIIWHFASTSSQDGTLDSWIAYNYKSGRWSKGAMSVEVALEYSTDPITYDTLGTLYSTYDDLPAISYDSAFWISTLPLPAIVDTSHQLKSLSGTGADSSITTGDYGDNIRYTLVKRIRPRYTTNPTTATLTPYSKATQGDTLTTGSNVTASSNRFDFFQSSRWHRFKLAFTGDVEIKEIHIDGSPQGLE